MNRCQRAAKLHNTGEAVKFHAQKTARFGEQFNVSVLRAGTLALSQLIAGGRARGKAVRRLAKQWGA